MSPGGTVQTKYRIACWMLVLAVAATTPPRVALAQEDVLIGVLDGTRRLTADVIKSGFNESDANYVTACDTFREHGDNFVLTVEMGEFRDNLVPRRGVTVCDLLTNPASAQKYVYAPHDPRNASWDGYTGPVPASQYGEALGGSAVGYVAGGRDTLSFWGDNDNANHTGGCCALYPNQLAQWYRPFRLLLFPKNDSWYLAWGTHPVLAVADAPVVFEVNVWNMRSEPCDTPIELSITTSGKAESVKSNTGRYLHVGEPPGDGATSYEITVALLSEPSVANEKQLKVSVPVSGKLPWDTKPCDGSNVPELVHFGPMGSVITEVDQRTALEQDWFAPTVVGGTAHFRPVPGQSSTAQAGILAPVTRTWTNVTTTDGVFSADVPCGSLQFYSFAVYSAASQRIVVQYDFDTAAAVFFGERRFVPQISDAAGTGSFVVDVTQGYHQVLVKLYSGGANTAGAQNCAATSKFSIRVLGTALGYTHSVKPYIPEGAYELWSDSYMFFMLHLGEKPDEYLYGGLDEDFIEVQKARPKEGDQLLDKAWTTTVFYAGQIPVSGDAIPADKEAAVTYTAFAIFNGYQSPAHVRWRFVARGKTDFYIDGVNVYSRPSDVGSVNETVTTDLNPGWHEVICRAAATRGQSWILTYFIYFENFRLGGSLAPGTSLPVGAVPVTRDVSIPAVLALRHTEVAVGAIPFDPSNTTASGDEFADIPVDPSYTPGVLSPQPVYALGKTRAFEWVAVTRADGVWSERAYGGNFNQYWALALYATEPLETKLRAVFHGGYAFWLDGAVQDSQPVTWSTERETPLKLSTGWHQLVVKLKANNSFHLIDSGSDTMTWTRANAECASRGGMQLCRRESVCPLGVGHPGRVPVESATASTFVPVADVANEWVQVFADGGDGTALCQSWGEAHNGSAPEWGEAAADVPQRRWVPCCGGNPPPSLSLSLGSPSAGELGYTYDFPIIIDAPVLAVKNPAALTQAVTMTTATPDATIQYALDDGVMKTYTDPVSIAHSATITAQAFKDGRESQKSRLVVSIPSTRSTDRASCVESASCPLVVSGVDPGWRVALLTTTTPGKKLNQYRREAYAVAQPPSAQFSGVLVVGEDNDVAVPVLGSGSYNVLLWGEDGLAELAISPVAYRRVEVSPEAVVGSQNTAFQIGGGVLAGDVALLPFSADGSPTTCDAATCFKEMSGNLGRVAVVRSSGGAYISQDLYGFSGELRCLCLCLSCSQAGGTTAAIAETKVISAPVSIRVSSAAPPTSGEIIAAVRPTSVSDGTTLELSGKFDAAGGFAVRFESAKGASNASVTPSCTAMSATTSSVTCTMVVHAGTMGGWNVVLSSARGEVPFAATATRTLRVSPPLPSVTAASGGCAVSSAGCATGAIVTFHGTNFNPNGIKFNAVTIGVVRETNPITCDVTDVVETQLSCTLTVPRDKETGTFAMTLRIRTAEEEWSAEQSIGFLVLGAGSGEPGWVPELAASQPDPSADSPNSKVVIIVGVVVGILVVVLIIVAVMLSRGHRVEPIHDEPRELSDLYFQLDHVETTNTDVQKEHVQREA